MHKRTWLPTKPKAVPKPPIPEELQASILDQASAIVPGLRRRFCKKPKKPQFNWCDDIFVRWHRGSLYFVSVMRTPSGLPETFEAHAARIEYAGDGKFNLAVPMRRGWNTFKREVSLEECLKEVGEFVQFG